MSCHRKAKAFDAVYFTKTKIYFLHVLEPNFSFLTRHRPFFLRLLSRNGFNESNATFDSRIRIEQMGFRSTMYFFYKKKKDYTYRRNAEKEQRINRMDKMRWKEQQWSMWRTSPCANRGRPSIAFNYKADVLPEKKRARSTKHRLFDATFPASLADEATKTLMQFSLNAQLDKNPLKMKNLVFTPGEKTSRMPSCLLLD